MTFEKQEQIAYRLQRACETLQEASLLLNSKMPHGSTNRIYYACFYAVTALLLTKDITRAKHSGVLAAFNQEFIKTGLVSIEWGKFYGVLFKRRMQSDYLDLVQLDLNELRDELIQAEQFIQTISDMITPTTP